MSQTTHPSSPMAGHDERDQDLLKTADRRLVRLHAVREETILFRAHRPNRVPHGIDPRLSGIGVCRTDGTRRSLRVRDDAKRGERPCDLLAQLRHARLLVRIVSGQRRQLIDTLLERCVPLDRGARAFENPPTAYSRARRRRRPPRSRAPLRSPSAPLGCAATNRSETCACSTVR